jgi:hypothetical protein
VTLGRIRPSGQTFKSLFMATAINHSLSSGRA